MTELLHANLARLRRDGIFYDCLLLMALCGVFVALKTGADLGLDASFFFYALPLGFVEAAFVSLFLGCEYSDGGLRSKLIVGHSRAAVYLADLLTSAFAGVLLTLAAVLPLLAIGVPRLGFFAMGVVPALALFGVTLALAAACAALFTLVSLLCPNKGVSAVICLLGAVLLLALAAAVNSALQQPEFFDSFAYVDSSGAFSALEPEPNPAYLSGAKRAAYQLLLEINPAGQALLLTEPASLAHPGRMALLSLAVAAAAGAVGLLLFRRKDIN